MGIMEKAEEINRIRKEKENLKDICMEAGICWECGSVTTSKPRLFYYSVVCPKCGKIGKRSWNWAL